MTMLSIERINDNRVVRRELTPDWEADASVASNRYYTWKNLIDRTVALVLLLPGLPMIGVLVMLVRLTSRGPGIFRQLRVGKDGRNFYMYKLRSMRTDAEAGTGPVWCSGGHDPRVTRLGRVLRKLHLDELPQLFNVVKGEMSLIGPRPERPEFVEVLSDGIDGYRDRLAVLPGVTGLAQINLPPDTDLNSVRRKLVLDCQYIDAASGWLDTRILVCTILRMLGINGARAMRMMRLGRTVELPASVAESTDPIQSNDENSEASSDQVATVSKVRQELSSSPVVARGTQNAAGAVATKAATEPVVDANINSALRQTVRDIKLTDTLKDTREMPIKKPR